MTTIDARGWVCPKPIIETKRLMDTAGLTEVTTIVDNLIAVENMKAFAATQGYNAVCAEKEGAFYITLTRTAVLPQKNHTDRPVLLVASNRLGEGSEELGESLMKAYLYALTEADVKPSTVIFLNSGVFLSTHGSAVIEQLETLEQAGVEITSCGACLNYYGLEKEVAVGSISNMYAIVSKMNSAQNTIKL